MAISLSDDYIYDLEFARKLLGRCISDCRYAISQGDKGALKHLWAGSIKDQISTMHQLAESIYRDDPSELDEMNRRIDAYEQKLKALSDEKDDMMGILEKELENHGMNNGKIGIFWFLGGTLAALRESVEEGDKYGDFINPSYDHYEIWESKGLDKRYGDDYSAFPRGRVVFNTETGKFRLCTGSWMTDSKLKKICSKYGLDPDDIEIVHEGHYEVGAEADMFFYEKEEGRKPKRRSGKAKNPLLDGIIYDRDRKKPYKLFPLALLDLGLDPSEYFEGYIFSKDDSEKPLYYVDSVNFGSNQAIAKFHLYNEISPNVNRVPKRILDLRQDKLSVIGKSLAHYGEHDYVKIRSSELDEMADDKLVIYLRYKNRLHF